MRTSSFITLIVLAAACNNEPPVVNVYPDIDVQVPEQEPPTVVVEAPENENDTEIPADTDVAGDTSAPNEVTCDWSSDPDLSLFDLPAFVSVRSGEGFVLEIPLTPDCGDISITRISIDGRFVGELDWMQTFESEPLAADSVGYWQLNAFGVQQFTGRYTTLGYSPGVNGTADYLMTWDRDIYSSPSHSTRLRGGEAGTVEVALPNLSGIFETGRIGMTVWIHFKDLQTGHDTYQIDQLDVAIVD